MREQFPFFLLLMTICGTLSAICEAKIVPFLMPNVVPEADDATLCVAMEMPRNDHQYIVAFYPNITSTRAHHIIMYGCTFPGMYKKGNPQYVWDCGRKPEQRSPSYKRGKACKTGKRLIYTWGLDTPPLDLPDGAAFKVGKDTGIDYMVMEIHYTFPDELAGKTDNSGVLLKVLPSSDKSITKTAGLVLLGTGGEIPAKSTEHMEVACVVNETLDIHPFAFLTHTHHMGQVVAGYKIEKSGKWELIGKHYPMDIEKFYPTANVVIKKGDILAARCTTYNYRNHYVSIGPLDLDEMCNFYMMFYIESDKNPEITHCFSDGPPTYYWRYDPLMKDIPHEMDRDASILQKPYMPLPKNDVD